MHYYCGQCNSDTMTASSVQFVAWRRGCVILVLFILALNSTTQQVDVNPNLPNASADSVGPDSVQSQDNPLSVEINSEWTLFTVQNTSNGITITITPLCSEQVPCAPQSFPFPDIFLPFECTLVPCDYKLLKVEKLNKFTTEYVIGVPSIQSMLLLRFVYEKSSHYFVLNETAVANAGITRYGCTPTSVVQLNNWFYTLCIDVPENRLRPLSIDNLGNLTDVSFNPITDNWISPVTFPIPNLSVLSQSDASFKYILFASGKHLTTINKEFLNYVNTDFSDCVSKINKLQLLTGSKADPNAISCLLYCDQNYGQVNIVDIDEPRPVVPIFYNNTGYPVVCQGNYTTEKLTITTNGTSFVLNHDKTSFSLPGQDIVLQKSICFEKEEKIFFVYTSNDVGTILIVVDLLEGGLPTTYNLSHSTACISMYKFQYILEEISYDANNVSVVLYDVLKQVPVFEVTLNHTYELKHLLFIPYDQPIASTKSCPNFCIALSVIGFALLLAIISSSICSCVIWRKRKKQQNGEDQEPIVEQPDNNEESVYVINEQVYQATPRIESAADHSTSETMPQTPPPPTPETHGHFPSNSTALAM